MGMISESIRRRGISVGEVSYEGHRYPAEIIAHCVWLYHRFPLSFRQGACLSSRVLVCVWPAGFPQAGTS